MSGKESIMEMSNVAQCQVADCAYNKERECHAYAITVGGDAHHPQCDTFVHASVKGGDPGLTARFHREQHIESDPGMDWRTQWSDSQHTGAGRHRFEPRGLDAQTQGATTICTARTQGGQGSGRRMHSPLSPSGNRFRAARATHFRPSPCHDTPHLMPTRSRFQPV
jgi:hypothetical protein